MGTVNVYIISVVDDGREREIKCSSAMLTPDGIFIVADDQNYSYPSSALLGVAAVVEKDGAAEDDVDRKPWLRIR
ncbi:hypothetical protein [Neorhizobium alkalisoli]|jgi:hypothetical protein|uniref:hypothetical protein n=1 Tax=Neorhizobium alkalisoli TaxID=528178 RepID=UPI00119D1465|nr:hypothetical protein [Neorhizobium alkalisoli]